jgi:2,3-bisphosphoglycerate-dependent phosphoglycerate mutase
MPTKSKPAELSTPCTFYFVRHGATEPNERGLRCGGDLDVPLTLLGRQQAHAVAARMRAMGIEVGMIVCSALVRARETAMIIGGILGVDRLAVEPLLNERRLGAWNLLPVGETESLFARNVPPLGGESEEEFVARVSAMLDVLPPFLPSKPLVVSSKGVARVLNSMSGDNRRLHVANGEIVQFTIERPAPTNGLARI